MSTGDDDERPRAPRRAPKPIEVLRRPKEERKKLPAELEAFARGDDDALWRRQRSGTRVHDPRPAAAAMVPGVANRDARLVYEARVKRLRSAIAAGDEAQLAIELVEVVGLALWRANNVVGFDVFVEAVLGLPPQRARALAARGAAELQVPCEPAEETLVAMWMRAEAGLLEATPQGKASIREGKLILEVPIHSAAEALAGAGRRATPIAKNPNGPHVVVDRPKGVEPLSKIVERHRPDDE